MSNVSLTISLAIMSLIALVGLFVAANSVDGAVYAFGLLLCVFGVLFDFWLIKRYFDFMEAS